MTPNPFQACSYEAIVKFRRQVRPPNWLDGFTGRYTYRNAGIVLNGNETVKIYGQPLLIFVVALVAIAIAVVAMILIDTPEMLGGAITCISISLIVSLLIGGNQWSNNMEQLREVWSSEKNEKIRETNLSTVLSSAISKEVRQSLLP